MYKHIGNINNSHLSDYFSVFKQKLLYSSLPSSFSLTVSLDASAAGCYDRSNESQMKRGRD